MLSCHNSLQDLCTNADREGEIRLVESSADPAGRWEYGRLEIFNEGFWNNYCGWFNDPVPASQSCETFGYDNGTVLQFGQPYIQRLTRTRQTDLVRSVPHEKSPLYTYNNTVACV